jgi:hypothetical protein
MGLPQRKLDDLVKDLPPEYQAEVRDFMEFLIRKHTVKSSGKRLRQTWAGKLKQYQSKYSALELQQAALKWRTHEIPR